MGDDEILNAFLAVCDAAEQSQNPDLQNLGKRIRGQIQVLSDIRDPPATLPGMTAAGVAIVGRFLAETAGRKLAREREQRSAPPQGSKPVSIVNKIRAQSPARRF